jgi:hypothetical protein
MLWIAAVIGRDVKARRAYQSLWLVGIAKRTTLREQCEGLVAIGDFLIMRCICGRSTRLLTMTRWS